MLYKKKKITYNLTIKYKRLSKMYLFFKIYI